MARLVHRFGDEDPLAIAFVASAQATPLFLYPFIDNAIDQANDSEQNLYITKKTDRNQKNPCIPDTIMSFVLSVGNKLTEKHFDIKIDNIRFVGYPISIDHQYDWLQRKTCQKTYTINVVLALSDRVRDDTVRSYQELACQVVVALKHEQMRCCYLCDQVTYMAETSSEVVSIYPDGESSYSDDQQAAIAPSAPSSAMLDRELSLSVELQTIFDEILQKGVVQLHMNKWSEVNFSMPIKAYNTDVDVKKDDLIREADVYRFISSIKPYHSILLMEECADLIRSLPRDSSPALVRFLKIASPFKNLVDLAADSDLELSQVIRLLSHLVYWAKAQVIYPVCQSNVYVVTSVNIAHRLPQLSAKFKISFPGENLKKKLSVFCSGFPLQGREFEQHKDIQMIIWMLQHRLLLCLHDYVLLKPGLVNLEGLTSAHYHSRLELDSASPPESDRSHRFMEPTVHMSEMLKECFTEKGQAVLAQLNLSEDEKMQLIKLCPYFTGAHHCEEIMYYENIPRSHLYQLLNKLKDFCIVTKYPDPSISHFQTSASHGHSDDAFV